MSPWGGLKPWDAGAKASSRRFVGLENPAFASTPSVSHVGGSAQGLTEFEHETVTHSVGGYVREMAHANGIESFWSMLKRSCHGPVHHFSARHMQRYADEFAARQCLRERDMIVVTGTLAGRMVGRRLTHTGLTGS